MEIYCNTWFENAFITTNYAVEKPAAVVDMKYVRCHYN